MEIWKAYVEAQDIITKQYSQPFKAKYKSSINDNTHLFEYSNDDNEKSLLREIQKQFPEVTEDMIRINEGYFLFKSDLLKNLDKKGLEKFKKFCDSNYFDFIPKPCITGNVQLRKRPFIGLSRKLNIDIGETGQCFATLKQIKSIDEKLSDSKEAIRETRIGAISKIGASEILLNREFQRVEKYIKEKVGFRDFTNWGHQNIIVLKNVCISNQHRTWIEDNSLYDSFHRIIITPSAGVSRGLARLKKKGLELPDKINNEYHFGCNKSFSLLDLKFEIEFRKRSFNMYLGEGNFSIRHEQVFKINNEKFIFYIKKFIPSDLFQISEESETVSFDFYNEDDLQTNLKALDKIEELLYRGFNEEHRYKVQINYLSPLKGVSELLQEIPSVSTHINSGGTKCEFSFYFDDIDEIPVLKTLTQNKLEELDPSFRSKIDDVEDGLVRFNFYFRKEDYEKETQQKLQYLRGEELSSGKRAIGTLSKVIFPKLFITYEETPPSLEKDKVLYLNSSLKGEKDKIKRLSDTVEAIFGSRKIVNNKLKKILINASNAETIKEEITQTTNYLKKLRFVESELLASEGRLNDKQKEAIVKSLLGKDLFIIQGPPGTGKSTAIAEIIWQHIRDINTNASRKNDKSYKILVTSETNLAVDNALDKLRNKYHTLIKPIRFGSEEKLDKEGRRFALENLQNWMETGSEEFDEENNRKVNIIRDWINQIELRVKPSDDEQIDLVLSDWKKMLSEPSEATRTLFFNAYKKNVNVIGATCSSIGKLSSTEKQTRFFREYNRVYFPSRDFRESFNTEINFDLVIQDEASKASPPELALPCIYGKKAIIIGDHRQLPPMVNADEFKESLEYLANRSNDIKYKRSVKKLLLTIEKNKIAFEKSHFENLFSKIPQNLKSTFNEQYRMHPAINETIKQFYKNEGGLNCGLKEDKVELPDFSEPQSRFHGIEIENILSSDTHVLWLNVETPEYRKGTSRVNFGEIEATEFLINEISKSEGYQKFISFWKSNELDEKQIGIITFYGSQASELNKLKNKFPNIPLRISPVDRFQGMERNIVIVSTVRSNRISDFPNQKPDYDKYGEIGYAPQSSLGFAQFPNRLNVALSRAKRLLVIVGNAEHFEKMSIYRNVLKTIRNHPNGRVINFTDIKKIG
jgi:superfamily I DNA and/or RNA helicase